MGFINSDDYEDSSCLECGCWIEEGDNFCESCTSTIFDNSNLTVTVVGNVYQNPELFNEVLEN